MRKCVLAVGVVALTVAGCSGEATEQLQSTGTARPGSDLAAEAGSTEAEGPEPRLAVADADSGRIDIIDLATEEPVHSFDVENPSRLTTINERYVVAAHDGRAHVLDPGSWTIDHGDHSHSYTKDPAELGILDGDGSPHVTAGDRKVAVAFGGSTDLVDFDSLSTGEATVAAAVDGDAVPLSDHVVVATGDTVELRDGTGELVRLLDGTCTDMQGESVFSNYLVLACADGVLKVDASADFAATTFPYPEPGTRASALAQGARGALVAAPTATGVLVLDTRTGTWVEARTPDESLSAGVSSDGKTVFSVQTDGTFRVFDASTGAELSSTPVLSTPYDVAKPEPSIVVAGTRAYVSDPAGNAVTEIDYRDSGRVARTFDLDFSPASIGVVGA